jgi:hypothetical protein
VLLLILIPVLLVSPAARLLLHHLSSCVLTLLDARDQLLLVGL